MDKNNNLFDLIRSMNKTEKRYFKLESSKYSERKSNNYIRLFNAIEKQPTYNGTLLKSQFAGEKLGKNLSAQKYQLYELILKSLNNFHLNSSQNSKMLQMIGFANLLFERGLYNQCDKAMQKARKLDSVNNKLLFEMLLLRMEERNINVGFHSSKLKEQFDQLYLAQKTKGNEYLDFIEVRHLRNTLSYYDQLGFPRNKKEESMLRELGKHPIMQKDENRLPIITQKILIEGKALYFELLGDLSKAISYSYKHLAILSKSDLNLLEWREYIIACNNILIKLNKNRQYNESLKIISQLKALNDSSTIIKSQELGVRLFKAIYSNEFDIYTKTGDHKTAINTIEAIEKQLEKNKRALEFRNTVVFYYSFGVTYFIGKNYRRSIYWFNKIINHPEKNTRSDLRAFAKIISLIIHFELKNDSNIPYYIKSLSKQKRLFKAETMIIDIILGYQKGLSKTDMKNKFIKLKHDLLLLKNDKFEKEAYTYFDFISWAESKIQNRLFAEILKEKTDIPKSGN